jgi:hypothetical protein
MGPALRFVVTPQNLASLLSFLAIAIAATPSDDEPSRPTSHLSAAWPTKEKGHDWAP